MHLNHQRQNSMQFASLIGFIGLCLVMAGSLMAEDVSVFTGEVFVSFPGEQTSRISPTGGLYVHASIDPAGDRAVFWGGAKGPPRLWMSDFSSDQPRALTGPDFGAMEPAFDWSGDRIAFVSDRNSPARAFDMAQIIGAWSTRKYAYPGSFNIYTMDSDGTGIRQVTFGEHQDRRPAFSPDGKTIAFLSNRGTLPLALFTIAADGSGEPVQIVHDAWTGRPWFSADGQWIYFFTDVRTSIGSNGDPSYESVAPIPGTSNSRANVHRRICRVPASGGTWEPVSPEGLPRSHGTFITPNGRHLLFHSTREVTQLYEQDLGSGELRVINPADFPSAAHVTRARNGALTFDVLTAHQAD